MKKVKRNPANSIIIESTLVVHNESKSHRITIKMEKEATTLDVHLSIVGDGG